MKALVYGSPEYNEKKAEILRLYGVCSSRDFDAKSAVRKRIDYLKSFLRANELRGYVIGISGGVDSTTVGRLCQLACEELRNEDYFAQFIAMRLPAGVQRDEDDAQAAIKFINADKTVTVNVGDSARDLSDQGVAEFIKLEGNVLTPEQEDFHRGNLKARMRMASQFHIASLYRACVVSSDHGSEATTGFFTKFGDGAADLTVINGVNKTQVRMMAKEMGAPEFLWSKLPTADLEDLNPGKIDDVGFGFPYSELDKFLEGEPIDSNIEQKIVHQYRITQHKRDPIPGFTE